MNQIGDTILCFDEIDSTNEEAKRQALAGADHGLVIVAESQSHGRGRKGRYWESPPGKNIFMSLLLRPSFKAENASMITLVMALGVVTAIREATGLEAYIKWPNDIVINGKKAVGILTELMMESQYKWYLICGVGINVNQGEFPKELLSTATSLQLEMTKGNDDEMRDAAAIDRDYLRDRVLQNFSKYYELFCRKESMEELMEEYNALLVNKDSVVRVLDPKGEYEGTALKINDRGELLVKTTDGGIINVYAGEVSVRGIYGYV